MKVATDEQRVGKRFRARRSSMPTSDTDNAAHLNGAAHAAYTTAPLGDEVWGDEGMDDRHNDANGADDDASEPVEPLPSRAERRRRQRAEGGFDRAEDRPKELSDRDRAALVSGMSIKTS